jgi:hypothetical protein
MIFWVDIFWGGHSCNGRRIDENDTSLTIRLFVHHMKIITAILIFSRGRYSYVIRELSYYSDNNAYS